MASSGRTTPKPSVAPKPKRPHSMMVSSSPEPAKTLPNHGTGRHHKQREPFPLPPAPHASQKVAENKDHINPPKRPYKPHPLSKAQEPAATKAETGMQLSTVIDSMKHLPFSARVGSGMYGHLSESSLYQENIIVHFEMRLKVVEATIEKGGTYQIPLCSSNKFSLLHNPTDNTAQAMMGHYYETVGHILAQPHKPKVVCSTQSFHGPTPESSLQEGEVLFLSPNIRTKAFKSGKFLKCYNVETNEEKLLHESCVGGFTTQPERTKMSLMDLWESKYTNPPMKVIMYHQLPHIVLVKQVQVTLLSEMWEDSILVTRNYIKNAESEPLYGNVQMLRLLKDVGISLIPEDEEERDPIMYRKFCEETCHLFNEFGYSRIQHHLFNEDPVWPNHEEIQSSLYNHIIKTDWERFVVLKKPESAFKFLKRRKSTKNYHTVTPHESPETSLPVNSGHQVQGKLQFKGDEGLYQQLAPVSRDEIGDISGVIVDQPISDVATLLHEVNTVNRQMMIQVDSLRAEVEGLKMELRQTKNMLISTKRDLSSTIDEVRGDLADIKLNIPEDYVTMDNVVPMTRAAENIEILKTFTSDQVLQALDRLKLNRCKSSFERRKTTGAELLQCNEQVFEKDFGIHTGADVQCLLKLIQGSPSVWKLLESS